MDGLLGFLNSIWNFLNSFWIPLTIVVVGIVYFAVVYYKANRVVDKHRKGDFIILAVYLHRAILCVNFILNHFI